jgi:hypothetical protein
MLLIDTAAENAVDRNYVKKTANMEESFGLLTAGTELVVERRQMPTGADTIHFNLCY